jgi:hypothetical protein
MASVLDEYGLSHQFQGHDARQHLVEILIRQWDAYFAAKAAKSE